MQLQQWNDETMELLASQPLEEPSPSTALNLLSAIEQCQMAMTNTHVTNLTELASTLGAKTFKKRSDVVVKKLEMFITLRHEGFKGRSCLFALNFGVLSSFSPLSSPPPSLHPDMNMHGIF